METANKQYGLLCQPGSGSSLISPKAARAGARCHMENSKLHMLSPNFSINYAIMWIKRHIIKMPSIDEACQS